MKKKASKKKKPNTIKKVDEQQVAPTETSERTQFDFGGLPQRDLKKNLGCG
jgi:hypothetical protein